MNCRDCPVELIVDETVHPLSRPVLCPDCRLQAARDTRRRSKKLARDRRPKGVGPEKKDLPLTTRVRNYVNEIKASKPCMDCGCFFHHHAMDFDHRLGEIKVKDVSKMFTFNAVNEEIKKCDLICSNCHRVRTWKRSHPD